MLGKNHNLGAYLEDTHEARVKVANFDELSKESNDIEAFLKTFTPDPAFMYLQVIAMGAGEYYGCNKNGDYFPEKSLIMYHHTFEQNAKIFKEHNNKSDSPDYGRVSKSWYNPTMHRVELILAVDKAKAPDIVARIEAGEKPELSMGCKIPHDVCSICGNKAAKKNEYCDHIKYELKRVFDDGRQVSMINLQPTFFDISFVFRRADKIAFTLRKVASDIGSLEHVFDIEEKTASITKQVPGEAFIKVLNSGMYNMLPKLEASEPDLPPAMLDRLALKHSLPDILTSFLHSLVPMKPAEVTRIIIIQNGLPTSSFNDVLGGVLSAKRNEPMIPGVEHKDIMSMLEPYLQSRSSYGPLMIKRVLHLGHSKTASDSDIFQQRTNDAQYYKPVYENELTHYKYNYSTIPVQYSPEEYQQRRQELSNRSMRKPMNPFTLGLMLGAMYASYRGVTGLKSVVDTMSSNKGVLTAGALALAAVGAARGEKRASVLDSKFTTHFALPFIGAHLASAHYRNKYMRGEELNGLQKFVAENPDYISIAAPFAAHFGAKHYSSYVNKVASQDKLADFADTLSQAALTGIIFRGRGMSGLGNVADQAVDTALMGHVVKTIAPKEEVKLKPYEYKE